MLKNQTKQAMKVLKERINMVSLISFALVLMSASFFGVSMVFVSAVLFLTAILTMDV